MVLPDATLRFLRASGGLGVSISPQAFPAGTKTAGDAAAAIGCEVAQIVKSLVFVADDDPVIALVPGDLRLDPELLAAAAGAASVRRAELEEVRQATGYAAGGTPPFGHVRALRVFADLELRRHEDLWAAAGTPTTVFPITIDDLERASGAAWASITERS
jgi:prolyl-tRNA editing enzyme YbaK/EbsC (Cys-tRNA(Pro) deacylase)